MALHNSELADAFTELADLLELEGANPFRVRAYRNLTRTISTSAENVADMVMRGRDLTELPGIGADLAGKIATLVQTGKLPILEEARGRTPPHLRELLRVPGLGPKKVRVLCDDLQIHCLADLKAAAGKGLIHEHRGFGEKTEHKIAEEIQRLEGSEIRLLLEHADQIVPAFLEHLMSVPGVRNAVAAGSYRRRKETVGDIDLLVAVERPGLAVMQRCVQFEEVAKVLALGGTKASVQLRSGIQVDVRSVRPNSFGAALVYFTGSKAHNIRIRKLGQELGLKVNEYGVFKGTREIGTRTETDVYRAVQLPFIEPELREDAGEIEAAQAGALPSLIQLGDIRGDLHCHTTETDGRSTLKEMAEAGKAKGYEYIAISDHSRRVAMAHGLDAKRLQRQVREIERLNANDGKFRILKSCEVDILEDGRLDLPDSILKQLDLVTASIHHSLNQPEGKQTDRVLRALDNPHVRILGHPTGRLINKRPGIAADMGKIIRHAKSRGVWLEINAQPERLDLDDVHARLAREEGATLVISTDAHHTAEFGWMRYGVDQARRAWIGREQVANTRDLASLLTLLGERL